MIVGLWASADRLIQVRRNRLATMGEVRATDYIELESVRAEIAATRKLFEQYDWPSIDVSRRSIEETSATIQNLLAERQEKRLSVGLILASSSVTRAKLLQQAGVSFAVQPAHIDEDAAKAELLAQGAGGHAVAGELAARKALHISASEPDALVLGADQVLVFDSALVSKSNTMDDAAVLLRGLSGKRHALVTAAVLARNGVPLWRHVESVWLWMRPFGDDFLAEYLSAEGVEILGSVGCYRFEGRGAQLFERVEGDYFSILGLPLLPLLAALREQGAIAQ